MSLADLITRRQAALLCRVSPRTVDDWVARGLLRAAAKGPGSVALYIAGEVIAVERQTRHAGKLRVRDYRPSPP